MPLSFLIRKCVAEELEVREERVNPQAAAWRGELGDAGGAAKGELQHRQQLLRAVKQR